MCKVHNNAGSDCILKESVQLNFDEDMAVKDLGANQAKRKTWQVFLVQDARVLHRTEGYKKKHNKQDQFLAETFLWSVDDTAWSHWKVLRGKLIVWPPQSARSVALAQALHTGFNLVRPYVESCKTLWLFMIDWLLSFTLYPIFEACDRNPALIFFGEGKWSASLHLSLDTAWMLCMLKKLILPNYARTCQNHDILSYTTLSLSLLTTHNIV